VTTELVNDDELGRSSFAVDTALGSDDKLGRSPEPVDTELESVNELVWLSSAVDTAVGSCGFLADVEPQVIGNVGRCTWAADAAIEVDDDELGRSSFAVDTALGSSSKLGRSTGLVATELENNRFGPPMSALNMAVEDDDEHGRPPLAVDTALAWLVVCNEDEKSLRSVDTELGAGDELGRSSSAVDTAVEDAGSRLESFFNRCMMLSSNFRSR